MSAFDAAVCQLSATDDRERNLGIAGRLVADAAGRGCKLVVLPERFATYGPQTEIVFEDDDGPTVQFLSATARQHGVYLAGGATLKASGSKGTNTLLMFGPDGERVARYDKIHLFKVKLGSLDLDETISYDRGAEPVVAATELGKIGLSICYDLRFPELYRELRGRGADVILIPAAFTVPTGQAHWRLLLRARAVENQCYVLASDQGGDHDALTPPSYGHSAIYDPWGEPLSELADEAEGIAVGTIDPARIEEVRSRIPCWSHRVM